MNETMQTQDRVRRDPITIVKWVLAALALIYSIAFVAMNRDEVSIDFIFFTAEASLVVALVLVLALGAILGWALSALGRRHD